MNDEQPGGARRGILARFALAGALIVLLSGGATAAVVLNTASGIASEVFVNQIDAPKGVVTPEYNGGPQTFLVLGSDRREGSKDSFDREDPPHSDTILLVRFDPSQGQTSVLSIPRDLMVNITTREGQYYPSEKINAAYTLGSKLGGAKEGIVLAAETIESQVFPGLRLNGIVDVNFRGFMKVVDTLGCAYVNVDHRYLGGGSLAEDYSAINLQPGYQKLCYENALAYVRYRHTDSDFVRVARQQDFLRDLREQISPEDVLGQIDTVAKAVGSAIASSFKPSAGELLELAKLIAFSQNKPLRQVKFLSSNADYKVNNVSYVTSTPELEHETLEDFLHGDERVNLPSARAGSSHSTHGHHHSTASGPSAAALDLFPSATGSGVAEASRDAAGMPFPLLYPKLQTGPAEEQEVRPYDLRAPEGTLHHAYVVVWRVNAEGAYYDFEGTDWRSPPLFAHARHQSIAGRSYDLVDDGSHIHVIGWVSGGVRYWLTNTLLEELSNAQMIAIARSARAVH
jgi:polyisoprenyl-teichoic acid--peptidoglycan teichoic acid transferase